MLEGVQLRYGWVAGGKAAVPVAMLASERVDAPGSRFVEVKSGSGYAAYLDDGDDNEIFGSVESPYGTNSSTSGQDIYSCIVDPSAIYKVPVNSGTYTIADMGDTCDVGVTSFVQGATLQTSNDEHLIILGGDAIDGTNWVLVRTNPFVQGETNSA